MTAPTLKIKTINSCIEKLKKMMNNVYSILETKKDDPGILVTLKQLIRVWPNKDPRRPIGKLFKRFRSNRRYRPCKCMWTLYRTMGQSRC